MRMTRREAIGTALAFSWIGSVSAAEGDVVLAEAANAGNLIANELQLALVGRLKIDRDGKPDQLPIEAKAKHTFSERLDPAGKPLAVRHYPEALSESAVSGERGKKQLAEDRRGILVYREAGGPLHVSPGGPLTREELELVSEHFETLAIPGLLPGKAVKVGDTWAIANDATQSVCHFDGLVKNELVGKLAEVKDGIATLAIDGKAEGVEHGAIVKLAVAAKLTFEIAKSFVTKIEWVQVDDREQGPVSPAMDAKVTISLSRTRESAVPKEIEALFAKRPADGKVPELLTQLRHVDPNGYEFVYPRDWHIVVKNDKHLVMRLLSRGESIAQATFAIWKPGTGDAKAILAEFVDATRKQPGWEPEKVLDNGSLPAGEGRQLYRISASGKQDGLEVVQSFHLIGGGGKHLAVATVCNANAVEKVGARDVALVSAVEFTAKK